MKKGFKDNDVYEALDDKEFAPKADSRPFSRILQDVVDHLTEIIRSELRLAHAEVREDVAQVSRAGIFLAIGGAFALCALGFVLLGAVYALGTRLEPWVSAVLVGVAAGVIGAILLMVGRSRIKQASLKPDTTIRSLQENVTWLKKQAK